MTVGRIIGENWGTSGIDPNACGVILVVVAAGGHRWHLATHDVHVQTADVVYEKTHFRGAILNDVSFSIGLDPFTRDSSNSTIRVDVLEDALPLRELRGSGIFVQDIEVDVYWHVEGIDHDFTQALHLVSGYMVEPVYDDERGVVSFSVEDRGLEGERPFPPIVATTDREANLDAEHIGKVYPVIFGTVKKAPCLRVSSDYTSWLVMEDRFKEFSNAQATEIYDGDTAVSIDVQELDEDAEGDGFYRIDADVLPTSKDVTADVTGYEPGTIDEMVRRLFNHYVTDEDMLEDGTLQLLAAELSRVEIGVVVNERMNNIIEFLRDRIVRQVPAVLVQYGRRYGVRPLPWSREVSHVLSTDTNIIRATRPPRETRRSAVFNDFSIKYGRSGLRGDHTGVVLRNPDNDYWCRISKDRYGHRAYQEVDCGDIVNQDGARYVSDWLVETFSKMRVLAGYAVRLDAAAINLWDTVQVIDNNQGWEHGPLFKVMGIGYGDGPELDLNLVSVDDYQLVHGAGQ